MFVTAQEIADRIGLDRRSIYHLVASAGLPAYRLSARRLLFDPAEVDEWIRQRRNGNGGDGKRNGRRS